MRRNERSRWPEYAVDRCIQSCAFPSHPYCILAPLRDLEEIAARYNSGAAALRNKRKRRDGRPERNPGDIVHIDECVQEFREHLGWKRRHSLRFLEDLFSASGLPGVVSEQAIKHQKRKMRASKHEGKDSSDP